MPILDLPLEEIEQYCREELTNQSSITIGSSAGGYICTISNITFYYLNETGEQGKAFIAGDFNGWHPNDPDWEMELNDNGYYIFTVPWSELPDSQYRRIFRFVINGDWVDIYRLFKASGLIMED